MIIAQQQSFFNTHKGIDVEIINSGTVSPPPLLPAIILPLHLTPSHSPAFTKVRSDQLSVSVDKGGVQIWVLFSCILAAPCTLLYTLFYTLHPFACSPSSPYPVAFILYIQICFLCFSFSLYELDMLQLVCQVKCSFCLNIVQ